MINILLQLYTKMKNRTILKKKHLQNKCNITTCYVEDKGPELYTKLSHKKIKILIFQLIVYLIVNFLQTTKCISHQQ